MNNRRLLSRQILAYMLSLTFVIISIAILGSYLFYSFLINYFSGYSITVDEDKMSILDWLWIMISTIISLAASFFFTFKLSSRILKPLNSVAYSLKQISQGNLNARAFCSYSQLGEMNNLVNDFNQMAEKLQMLDTQRNIWNVSIAHELRTPVTILRGRLQGLVDGVFTPDPNLFVNLLRQIESLTNLIEDLRTMNSNREADYILKFSKENIKSTIQNALDTFSFEFQRKNFNIITELKNQYCIYDPLRITQCLTILFDNILKYSNAQYILIKNGISNGENFIIIEDKGPGIPEEFQELLFLPFQRGEYAKNINPEGCGLGLSVVKAIISAHGGNVSYELTREKHSIFKLSWPIEQYQ